MQLANNVTLARLQAEYSPSHTSFTLPYALLIAQHPLSPPCTAGPLNAHALLEDTKLYPTAPLAGSDLAVHLAKRSWRIGVAHEYDDNVRAHSRPVRVQRSMVATNGPAMQFPRRRCCDTAPGLCRTPGRQSWLP